MSRLVIGTLKQCVCMLILGLIKKMLRIFHFVEPDGLGLRPNFARAMESGLRPSPSGSTKWKMRSIFLFKKQLCPEEPSAVVFQVQVVALPETHTEFAGRVV